MTTTTQGNPITTLAPDLRRRALNEISYTLDVLDEINALAKERRRHVGAMYAFLASLELVIDAGLDNPGISGLWRDTDDRALKELIRYIGGPIPAERLGFTEGL